MAYWQIRYFDESGNIQVLPSIKADSSDQALQLSGLPDRIVHTVQPDYFGGLKALVFERRFPIMDQVVYLASIASKIEAGKTPGRAIKEAVPFHDIGVTEAQLDACEKPKDYLNQLRFHETAILLAETGDQTGNLATSLELAHKTISERYEAEAQYRASLKKGIFYIILGILFALGVPLTLGPMINDLVTVQKLPLNTNRVSDSLVALNSMYRTYGVLLIAMLALAFAFRERIWDAVRTWPLFRLINNQIMLTRAIAFVSNYKILSFSGYSNQQCFKFLASRSKGMSNRLYNEALERQIEGCPISEIFDNPEWPPILHQNLNGFEELSPLHRESVLVNLNKAMKIQLIQAAKKVSNVALYFGSSMMVLAIFALALGFYLPLISISSGFR